MAEKQPGTKQRLAHALLSPLTVILGSAEMLQSQATAWSEQAQELLDLVLGQARRLQATLSELLATAEIEGDTVRLSWCDHREKAGSPAPAPGPTPAPGSPSEQDKKGLPSAP